MHSKLLIVVLMVLMSVMLVTAQTLNLETHGVAPRQAEEDTLDIFTHGYNSLLNVGVETQMYLKAFYVDSTIGNLTWTVTGPATSTADVMSETAVDTATKVVVFTPDVVGTYTVEVTDGTETASLVINAGTYRGIADGGCANCHSSKHAEWQETGHASMLERGLEGTLSSHYGESCISCHTVGYDVNADNGGFDDREFVFPDTLYPGVYAATVTAYPEAMKLANIQCESCHGPGSAHYATTTDSKMVSSWDAQVCAICHDEGTHHAFPAQWRLSVHASGGHLYAQGGSRDRSSCMPCHNGAGFVADIEGEPQTETEEITITCVTCHDPHNADNPHQLRAVDDVVLGNGVVVSDGGNGKMCMNCHKGRRDAPTYTGTSGPHHGPQTDLLVGTNAYTFGKTLPTSPHLAATENACADCHMAGGVWDDARNEVASSGGHTFEMVNGYGEDHVEVCAPCHGDVGTSFNEKKYFFQGNADHDGDGTEEGVQEEIHGLLEELGMLLPPIGSPEVDLPDEYTETERKAAFNYLFIEEDRSGGVHNPAYAVALLKVSIQAVMNSSLDGEIVAIEDVPNDQGKQVRIVWDSMADDGIADDPVEKYLIKRFDNDSTVWTTVGEATATGSARYALVVPTLYDTTATEGIVLTSFKVVALTQSGMTYESMEGQGWSADNLAPMAPQNLKGTVGANAVALTWDESLDKDFNYFAVYRSTEQNFDPAGMTPVATLTQNQYDDADITVGQVYYYKVSAIDFAGNESDYSAEETVSGLDTQANSDVPSEFVLAQNYPNPFNPSTTVRFGLPQSETVKIIIYNVLGEPVRTLADGNFAAGYHKVTWDGRNNRGQVVSAGMYIYRMESPSTTMSQKMLFIK